MAPSSRTAIPVGLGVSLPQNGVEARRRPGGEIPEVSLCGPADSHVVQAAETACDASAQPFAPGRSRLGRRALQVSPPGPAWRPSPALGLRNRPASVFLYSELMFLYVSDAVPRPSVDVAI